ncbi:cytochrome P450 [Aspergillus heterothallicus]
MRHLHPLSKYPGPFLASLSNTYKAYYVYNLNLHEKLLSLHKTHGPVIRIGPNHLHTWAGDAIAPIYKAGRTMPKSEYYDAFTAFNPNLFGGRDEAVHALRRRQLAHGFAQSSIVKLERLIEAPMAVLVEKLNGFAVRAEEEEEVFDFKEVLALYVLDILGEVAFGKSFGAQRKGASEELHAIGDHLLLSGVIGELPGQNVTKLLARLSPVPWMRRLVKSREALKRICAGCVRFKIENPSDRPDLLKSLVEAVDPESGEGVAGSHSTAGTLTFLLWHLIHNPPMLARVQAEIDDKLGPLREGQISYPITGLEASLPYTMACVRENFRMNPVFSMPLWRTVRHPGGVDIAGGNVPYGTNICISNYVLHHNPSIWGADHDEFKPARWLDEKYAKERGRYLIPFSVGHRQCIGRNLGMTNLLKSVTALVSLFDFEAVDAGEKAGMRSVRLLSSGIGEMEGPFMVRVRVRKRQ